MSHVLSISNLGHRYRRRHEDVEVFQDISLQIDAGEIVAVRGESGAGKSTLLLCCGGMLKPSIGDVCITDRNLYSMSPAQRCDVRAKQIGFLFQTLQLIPYLTVLQNIKTVRGVTTETASDWLRRLGLSDRADHKPCQLSHGQRQRAALVRALAHSPKLLIADEPTGNLDQKNSELVFQAMTEFAGQGGAVLIATHDLSATQIANRVYEIQDGKLLQLESNSL